MTHRVEQIGPCELHLGDCRDVLRAMDADSIEAVLTDPPYGVNLGKSKENNNRKRSEYGSFDDTQEAVIALMQDVLPECRRVASRVVLTPGLRLFWTYPRPEHTGALFQPAGAGCNAWGFSCWQPILYYGRDPYAGKGSRPDSFELTEAAKPNGHPCPKPIKIWTKLLNRMSLEGETICDPFMGSGTTGAACIKTGRKFIGVEIDPAYYEIALKRIRLAWQEKRSELPLETAT